MAASDPIVAITSIMSQSDEIFASGEESAKQHQGMPETEGNFEVFENGAEQMSEVAHTETAAPNAGLPALQGRKVRTSYLLFTLNSETQHIHRLYPMLIGYNLIVY